MKQHALSFLIDLQRGNHIQRSLKDWIVRRRLLRESAAALLRRITALPHHHFWADDVRFAESRGIALSRVVGHQQVTDAHLVGLAVRHKGCLVTFDRGVRSLVPDGQVPERVVTVLASE